MAIDLSEGDHDLLDGFLSTVLRDHKRGKTDLESARSILAHAFTMIARDDAGFRDYMRAEMRQPDEC